MLQLCQSNNLFNVAPVEFKQIQIKEKGTLNSQRNRSLCALKENTQSKKYRQSKAMERESARGIAKKKK